MGKLSAVVRLMRPAHWFKNVFVVAPLAFAPHVLSGENLARTAGALACFCLAASAAYALNDWCDREADRTHPLSRTRPLAAGTLPAPDALRLAALLAALALAGALVLAPALAGLLALYTALNAAYSLRLKVLPVIGAAVVVAGFLLRVGAGAVAIGVPPSPWILVITTLVALLLVVGKRRADLGTTAAAARRLDIGLYGLTAAAFLFFTAYGLLGPQPKTLFSVPLVALGLARYLLRVTVQGTPLGPTELILSDWVLLPTIVAWSCLVLFLVHG